MSEKNNINFMDALPLLKVVPDDETYEALMDYHGAAEKRGQVVVLPKPNELFIDIDSEEQYVEFLRRFDCDAMKRIGAFILKDTPSKSGLPKRHITIECCIAFNNEQRIMYQAALNDDPLRVYMGMRRIVHGVPEPVTFFEYAPHEEKKEEPFKEDSEGYLKHEACPHGNVDGLCNKCCQESDIAYDAARERSFFGKH